MGVDATLFVIADYSTADHGFVEHVFSLERDRDLWPALHAIPKRVTWPVVQLPNGSWSWLRGEERPAEYKDRECGWLDHDSYGGKLHSFFGRDLEGVVPDHEFNAAVLDFVRKHFADDHIIVFWH